MFSDGNITFQLEIQKYRLKNIFNDAQCDNSGQCCFNKVF